MLKILYFMCNLLPPFKLSMVLSLMLIISAVPTAAFAETGEDLSQAAIEINAALREPDKKSKEPEGGFFIDNFPYCMEEHDVKVLRAEETTKIIYP